MIYENTTYKVTTGQHPDNKNLTNIYLVTNKEHGVIEHVTPKLYEALAIAIAAPQMIEKVLQEDSSEFIKSMGNVSNLKGQLMA